MGWNYDRDVFDIAIPIGTAFAFPMGKEDFND
jgi:hypothetical protein